MLGRTGPFGAVDDYEVSELLEVSGGQGFVLRARLTSDRLGPGMTGLDVSLKQLIAGAVGVGRIRELDAIIGPRTHPNLSRQLEVFRGPPVTLDGDGEDGDDSVTYVAAAWVDGETIDRAGTGQTLDTILRWTGQVADAIDFLHADCHTGGPVLHRDIKPHNVIVDRSGRAVLIDPGLARPLVAGATGTPHGSPGYIPPEAQGGLRPSTAAGDRWQLAALAFCLIVGEPPGRMTPEEIRERLTTALSSTHRSGPIVELIALMLDQDPSRRPARATDWARDLRVVAARQERPSRKKRHRHLALQGAIACAIVLAASVGFLARPVDHDTPAAAAGGNGAISLLPRDSRIRTDATNASQPVTVDNKVTNGPTLMREDVPAYLSTIPQDYCREDNCFIPGTYMVSETQLTAVCETIAEGTTNGDNQTQVDLHNPGRATSDLWYGIRLPKGTFGYLSVVWLAPDERDLNLPQC